MKNLFLTKSINQSVILFGGKSSERFVSVASAKNLCQHLPEAALWFWHPEGPCFEVNRERLLSHERPFEFEFPISGLTSFVQNIDEALRYAAAQGLNLILALHGGEGEDGILAARCETLNVPFTGSGSHASQLAFDKIRTKELVAQAGVYTLPWLALSDGGILEGKAQIYQWLDEFGALVGKPVCDGSSHGVYFLHDRASCETFFQDHPTGRYLIEPLAKGVEATVGVIDSEQQTYALEPVEIRLPGDSKFDYSHKYLDPNVSELCPSTFPADVISKLKEVATSVHQLIGAEGYSRSDFIVQADKVIFLEINTLPGLTKASLLPKALEADEIELRDFLLNQVNLACARCR